MLEKSANLECVPVFISSSEFTTMIGLLITSSSLLSETGAEKSLAQEQIEFR